MRNICNTGNTNNTKSAGDWENTLPDWGNPLPDWENPLDNWGPPESWENSLDVDEKL